MCVVPLRDHFGRVIGLLQVPPPLPSPPLPSLRSHVVGAYSLGTPPHGFACRDGLPTCAGVSPWAQPARRCHRCSLAPSLSPPLAPMRQANGKAPTRGGPKETEQRLLHELHEPPPFTNEDLQVLPPLPTAASRATCRCPCPHPLHRGDALALHPLRRSQA